MSLLGMPMIGWVWAGVALLAAILWTWDRWRGRNGSIEAAPAPRGMRADVRGSAVPSGPPGPADRADRWRPSPAQRESGDAAAMLRRVYGPEGS